MGLVSLLSWVTRPEACGHRRCTAARRALLVAGPVLYLSLPFLLVLPTWKAVIIGGASAIACGVALAVSCGGDDIEAIADATREDVPDFIPAEWVRDL